MIPPPTEDTLADVDDHPILFIPGPTEVDPELRAIMAMPLQGHRDGAVKKIVTEVCAMLQPVLRTTRPCFVENTTATGVMEASVRNLIPRRSLHLTCGAFGERWVKISRACGRDPVAIEVDWGSPTTASHLRSWLQNHEADRESIDAVCITHSETSTGVLNPLAELSAVVREELPEALVLVDTVTSLAGAQLEFDDWGLDLVFGGTQKCLALPPGLAVYTVSARALERAASIPDRGWLIDFVANVERFAEGATPATPCVPLFYALHRQLQRITADGIEARWSRHLQMQGMVEQWAATYDIPLLVEEKAYRSPTVTALRNGGHDGDGFVSRAAEAGFKLGKGYGKLKSTGFRVGHMGDHTPDRLANLLEAIAPR